ncbi:Orn/Lys/Arg decarboxylase N-terminal domain-containing protein [Shewanella sp. GXUN23E]
MKANRNILFVANEHMHEDDGLALTTLQQLCDATQALGFQNHYARSIEDGLQKITGSHHYSALLLLWDEQQTTMPSQSISLLTQIRQRNPQLPIFLIAEQDVVNQLPLDVIQQVKEYIYLYSETPAFTANRINTAVQQYYQQLLPVYFKTLKEFTEAGDYYWDCPGHMGGMAYTKHPVGAEFLNFYGENMLRSDIGVATGEMGDYLEHTGVPYLSEQKAAKLFGAKWTFYCVGGSSASNRIVSQGAVGADEITLVDRNCHKSLNHGLTLCRARPVYLQPTRNGYGMIGPIPNRRMTPEAVQALLDASPLVKDASHPKPTYAVVTNCTYDGFCYNAGQVASNLGQSVPRLHFDEAWYAYAKFHPLYQGRYAMGIEDDQPDRPTLFAVQSTHKMLPSLSMASMIHVKPSARAPVNYEDFNDAFMMHGTTSPFYPIIASMDVAVAMMEGDSGRSLMQESLDDAIEFRKAVVRIKRQFAAQDTVPNWFFDVLQPTQVTDPNTGETFDFEQAPAALLSASPACWQLLADDEWHGFAREDIEDTDCMLDPVKVTITCPGVTPAGEHQSQGIPGYVVAKFLDSRHTEIARTGDYTLLILFSVGTTRGKWGTLVESLAEFKRLYDSGVAACEAIPSLRDASPIYRNLSLKELCDLMHRQMSELKLLEHLAAAVNTVPQPVMSPAEAYQKVVRYQTESIPVSHFGGRIAASMLVPYPPGIPVLMPGERVASDNAAIVSYLLALQSFDRQFPGFEHEIHGVKVDDQGNYHVRAIIEDQQSCQPQTECRP